jgi:hypothetical protein
MKLMEMGGKEEILLEKISSIVIMQGILPEVIATILINPSLKGDTICIQVSYSSMHKDSLIFKD